MKNIFLSLVIISSFTALIACKNSDKKTNKAAEVTSKVKKETKKTINKVVEETKKSVTNKQDPKLIAEGKELFTSKTCTTCHHEKTKLIGPALEVIAKTYKEKNAKIMDFLKGKSEAIVDIPLAAVMKVNVETITKKMPDDQLLAITAYIESTLK